MMLHHATSPDNARRRYKTVEEFCEANGLQGRRIAWYAEQLNKLWIKGAPDPAALRELLDADWKNGVVIVKGTCDWIIELLKLGATLRAPTVTPDGTAFILKSKERDALLRTLEETYRDIILTSLRFSAPYVDSRVTAQFNRRSLWHMQVLSTKLKLLWALLGYSTEECNLDFYLKDEPLVKAELLPIFRADVQARRKPVIPERLIELEDSRIQLLEHASEEETQNLA